MKSTQRNRAIHTALAFLLVIALSFSVAFADAESPSDTSPDEGTQTEVTAEDEGGNQEGQDQGGQDQGEQGQTDQPQIDDPDPDPEPEPEPQPTASVIKKGDYYYYKDAKGAIRKKAGFVTLDNKIYYVTKGGKIKANATFKVGKSYYRAGKNGVIKTGIYKWGKKYWYSNSKGILRKKAGFLTWKGKKYYTKKGGAVIVSNGFTVKNIAYVANSKGQVTKVVLSKDDNAVISVAKKQVGIMTGKTYWRWYYKTKFRDTDRTPWCGAFVAWVYNKAGMYKKISVAKRFGPLGYVPSYSRFANKYKKWIKKENARAGDIIVFGKNRHVGIVEGIYGKYIVTIEGNAGPTAAIGCGKPGAVVRKIYKINSKDIKGVIRVFKHSSKAAA